MNRRSLFKRLAPLVALFALAPSVKAEAAPARGYTAGGFINDPHLLLSQRTGQIDGMMWERGGEYIMPPNASITAIWIQAQAVYQDYLDHAARADA